MKTHERECLFTELFNDYRHRVMRLCHAYLNSPDEAEDLFQEIMTRVWASLPRFRGESHPGTWLYRIAVNTALLYRRKSPPSAPLEELRDGRTAPLEELAGRQRLAALRRAVAALPEQDLLIATLLLEGLSYKEIAEVVGLTVNHVGVKISRIKRALEKSLTEFGYGQL